MDLITRLFGSRRILVPVSVGLVALLVGGLFAYITIRDRGDEPTTETSASSEVETQPFVSRKGGYSLDVPTALEASSQRQVTTFTSQDKSLVVTVGPGERGRLKAASKRFVGTLRAGYRKFDLLGTQKQTIDGRPALVSFGQATNSDKVRIRFVAVVVANRPRNYTITAFTAFESDPTVVLPRVNAIVNSFQVLPKKG